MMSTEEVMASVWRTLADELAVTAGQDRTCQTCGRRAECGAYTAKDCGTEGLLWVPSRKRINRRFEAPLSPPHQGDDHKGNDDRDE